jgi:hypothetical protein
MGRMKGSLEETEVGRTSERKIPIALPSAESPHWGNGNGSTCGKIYDNISSVDSM